MGIFNEAGHNIGVFVLTFIGVLVFFAILGVVIFKIIVPLIIAKISQFSIGDIL